MVGAEVMRELFAFSCAAHPIGEYSVYVETEYNRTNWREPTAYHVFALAKVDTVTTEFDLRWHFQEESRQHTEYDYTIECSLWTYETLAEYEYEELRKRHAHDRY